jgi:hypothetical protein
MPISKKGLKQVSAYAAKPEAWRGGAAQSRTALRAVSRKPNPNRTSPFATFPELSNFGTLSGKAGGFMVNWRHSPSTHPVAQGRNFILTIATLWKIYSQLTLLAVADDSDLEEVCNNERHLLRSPAPVCGIISSSPVSSRHPNFLMTLKLRLAFVEARRL